MKRTCAIAALLALAVCCSGRKSEQESAEIVVGVFSSMTGGTATLGQATRMGSEMAAAEINAAGGVLGKRLRLVVEDDQGKPEEALTVVTKLITRDRVVAVIGENASSRSLAAAPVCQQYHIPMITPSSTNPKVTEIGDYIFRVCFIDPFQGEVMARFTYNSLKITDVAILRDIKNDYSVGLADVYQRSFEKLGGRIVGNESYSEGDTDFSAQLTALKSANPAALFVPGYYTEVGLIARQARKLGITVAILGGDGWESPKLWEIGGEALNGCYYSNHYSPDDPSPAIRKFVQAFTARFGRAPDAVCALAYDAMNLLAESFRRAGTTDGPRVRDILAATRGYPAVTGAITMDDHRNVIKPAVVLRVQDGTLQFVETVKP